MHPHPNFQSTNLNLNSDARLISPVTWLLVVKNGMPYLPQTLASIEAQTYNNWEVLVWDNDSTDGTLEVLREWIPSRLPGRVITGQPLGLGASRREIVKQAKTELCACIDADDVNLPSRLEKQVAYLENHPEIAVIGTQVNRLDADGWNHGLIRLPLSHEEIMSSLLYANGIVHPSVMFRRSAVLDAGNYRDVGPVNIEDYDLWLRLALRHKIANLDFALVNYRVHDNSTTQIAMAQNRLSEALNVCFCEHAPGVFACSKEEARLLRDRRHRRAVGPLLRIARTLTHSSGAGLITLLRSDSFVAAGKNLTSRRDIVTRLAFYLLDRHRYPISSHLLKLWRQLNVRLQGRTRRCIQTS